MLERNRFLAIKNLAKDIRKENEKIFKAFAKDTMEDAIRQKEEFIESVIESMEIAFSDGEQGKEEKQIFRANILIPDDLDFFNAYSKDKNIRNLMNKYSVSIEDIMSKITELNIYGKYLETFNGDEVTTDGVEVDADFVDEMVNLSSKETESLLDEIEDLSNVMDELNISSEETEEETPKEKNEENFEETIIDDEFDDISNVVSGFVDQFNMTQTELNKYKGDLETANVEKGSLKDQIASLQEENNELRKTNFESVDIVNKLREQNEQFKKENANLRSRSEILEKKVKQSAELLRKIYNSIPKK